MIDYETKFSRSQKSKHIDFDRERLFYVLTNASQHICSEKIGPLKTNILAVDLKYWALEKTDTL